MTSEIKNQKNESQPVKRDRINAIDILKGFSIFWIVGYHTTQLWLIKSALWEVEMLYIFFLSTVGPANFIMLSGLNLIIGIRSKSDSGWSDKRVRTQNLKRIGVLILLASIYNLGMGFIIQNFSFIYWYDFYSWHILQTISYSMLLTLLLFKINKYIRFFLGILVIVISYPLYSFLISLGSGGLIISHLFYYPFPDIYWSMPFFPWAGCAFMGSLIGEHLYNAKYKSEKGKNQLGKLIIYLAIMGIIFILIGIIFGSDMPSLSTPIWGFIANFHVENLNTAYFFNFISLPYFLLPSHWTYMFYALGIDFLLLSLFIFLSDYKKFKNRVFTFFSFTGKLSFSVFIYHHFGLILFVRTFNAFWIWPVWVGYAILIVFIVWILVTKFEGKGTVEWLIIVLSMERKPESEDVKAPLRE
ncbi:MAG: DUF1624 domain-containing protein [Promethearchaeota archaeon]|nr:MAG: DUF1624 domain-containing protein [Candidatus Lokiarchaeota archaeon]